MSYLLHISTLFMSCNPGPKLKNTVLSVQEINTIGELITAEYYGEVLSGHSLLIHENTQVIFQNSLQIIRDEMDKEKNVVEKEYKEKINNRKTKIKDLKKGRSVLFRKSRIKDLEDDVKRLEKRRNRKIKNLANNINSHKYISALELLKRFTGQNKKAIITLLNSEENNSRIYQIYRSRIEEYISKQEKKELVYLGRGSVKIGYDMKNIDSLNIFFSESRDTMYLINFDPYITDIDINPYFYYPIDETENTLDSTSLKIDNTEQKVDSSLHGFQLIYAKNQNKFTLNEISKLKSDCKLKLRQEALQKNVFDHAHKNAEQALEALLSLLLTDKNTHITKLIISPSKYFYYKSNYLFDSIIDENECEEIIEILKDDLIQLDSISFKHQTHAYQLQLLDTFLKELYQDTKGKPGQQMWDSLYIDYVTNKKVK